MKITKVKHHGQTRYRVNEPNGPDGKRRRKFFETRDGAERFVKERTEDAKAFGVHFSTITPKERAEMAYQLGRLKALGWTLAGAVDFIEKHGKAAPSFTLGKVADEFLAARATAGVRPRYLKTLRASIRRFLINRRDKLMADVTPGEIQEYITCNGWKPATMRSYLVDVRTLFAFALKRKYVRENVALAVDLPKAEDNPPGILNSKQAQGVLDACLDIAPDILPVVVLSLFGGLRRAEAEKLEWEEITEEFVEVKAHKAKTRQRRLIPISKQLRAWLQTARAAGGKLPSVNYGDKLKRVLAKAGLRGEWPQNALRHSFASYHFAKHKNENETASLMGNSPQMLFKNYRELVQPTHADAFFAIMPPADAVVRAEAARAPRRRQIAKRRSLKISAETMNALFDGGQRTLSRKEAVAALCSLATCSVPAAYNALSLEGRFKDQLHETGDVLTWRVEGEPTPAARAAETVTDLN